MLRVDHITKDWKEAGSFPAQINLYGFWNHEASSPRAATWALSCECVAWIMKVSTKPPRNTQLSDSKLP